MKRSILMLLVIGVAMIFFGCEKMDPLVPDSNIDQEITSLKAAKAHTKFTGECTPTTPPNPGDNAWYDDADDARVTGVSVWIIETVTPIDEITFKLRGTCELFVDDGLGKWEMSWHGTQTLTSPDGSTFTIVAHAKGTGVEGDVEGLTAKWKYSLDFDGSPETLKYDIKGKITGERGRNKKNKD